MLVFALLLSGCFVKQVVKSELSSYAEPVDGSTAYIRLIGSRNVKVYPNSSCVGIDVPGSGYPAGPQMGGQRKRDLGMPKPAGLPKHYVEIAARAGQPIAVGFSFYRESFRPGVAGTGAPGTRTTSTCYAASAFVPEVDQNYEAIADGRGGVCTVTIVRLAPDDAHGSMRRMPVRSEVAKHCGAAEEVRR